MTPPAARSSRRPGAATAVRSSVGALADGTEVCATTLTNARGTAVRVADYGGTVLSILAPDRHGALADIVLGHDAIDAYRAGDAYLGAIVGRYANRIAGGRFEIDGTPYRLGTNDGAHHLHGGTRGFDAVVWEAEAFAHPGAAGVLLRHTSPDGDQGYPGRLCVTATYTLTDGDALVVDLHATTDAPTPVNLSTHSYFNLTGRAGAGATVLGHRLTVDADAFLPVDSGRIPTGELRPVAGTPFDFRWPRAVGAEIDAGAPQLACAGGYDHCFVLDRPAGDAALRFAARLAEPESGRVLEVFTTEPGLQVYSGNSLRPAPPADGGAGFAPRTGLALEPQHFPDSPNRPAFPPTVLRPGQTYRSQTVLAFGSDAAPPAFRP